MKKTWFSITRVHPAIYAIAEFFHWEQVVSYLVVDKTKAFLIDTGMGYESIYSVVKKITMKPVTVLLTHAHWDHIGGVDEFDHVEIFDHEFERTSLKNGFISSSIPELMNKTYFIHDYAPKEYRAKGKEAMRTFREFSLFDSDTFSIECVYTPGHTPGSCCFFIEKYGALFTGDTLYPGPLYAFLPESNWSEYIHSVHSLDAYLQKVQLVFPGHNSIKEDSKFLKNVLHDFKTIPDLMQNNPPKEIRFNSFSFIWR